MSRYRTGRRNSRTIYIQAGPEPSDADEQVGTMDTAFLGRAVVEALNAFPDELASVLRHLTVSGEVPEAWDLSIHAGQCQDADGEVCPPDRCEVDGPHWPTHPPMEPG